MKTFLAILLVAVSASAAEKPRTVTLDVKDEDVVVVLKSMQQQCDIKNLVIDKEVQGRATFLFRELECDRAFDTVFRTMDLRAKVYSNDLVNVKPRSK